MWQMLMSKVGGGGSGKSMAMQKTQQRDPSDPAQQQYNQQQPGQQPPQYGGMYQPGQRLTYQPGQLGQFGTRAMGQQTMGQPQQQQWSPLQYLLRQQNG